ncbi:hypothetical protein CDL12_23338 [Handroanthus impetiginosus]|uniref:Putative plant transposon protein domain-containing protein n=1 Tax=Handroanthus impetiginosus TaxID=429701 RepID=A0A2G9GFR4_9LAMI|nr:hypothetical protein CDL12_23338 [Handroanthus impetiginosus]
MVRNEIIDFSTSTVNRLFGTPTSNDPNKYNEIPRSSLTNEAWDWLLFINTYLYPSSHLSKVSKDHAVLLYAILMSIPLDIGRYIYNTIQNSARALLQLFVSDKGLVNVPRDELIQLDTTINEKNQPPSLPPAQFCQCCPRSLLQQKRHILEDQNL